MEIEPGPGANPFPDDLKARLRAAVEERGEPPRTRHLRPDGGPVFTQPPGAGSEPLPPPAFAQSGRLAPVGRRSLRGGAGEGQAGLPLRRLLHLPLVPRDGRGVVRGPRDRGAPQPALRPHQGRPRGAARRGQRLHASRATPHPARRLADERVPRARSEAVLRRHLLPSPRRDARRAGGVRHHPAGAAPRLLAGA